VLHGFFVALNVALGAQNTRKNTQTHRDTTKPKRLQVTDLKENPIKSSPWRVSVAPMMDCAH
jgi:hypothetical protein